MGIVIYSFVNGDAITTDTSSHCNLPTTKNRMRKLMQKLKRLMRPRFTLVYRKRDGASGIYEISRPRTDNTFGNIGEGEEEVGFRAYCYNRENWRSFRHDGVISMVKN